MRPPTRQLDAARARRGGNGASGRGSHSRERLAKLAFGLLLVGGLAFVAVVVGYAAAHYGATPIGVAPIGGLFVLAALLITLHRPKGVMLLAIASCPIANLFVVDALFQLRLSEFFWWSAALATLVLALLGRRRLKLSGATLAITVYAVYFLVSGVWAQDKEAALREAIQFFTFVVLFIVVDNLIETSREMYRAIWMFVLGTGILAVGAIVGKATPILPSLTVGQSTKFLWRAELFNPVVASGFIGTVCLILGALILSGRGSGGQRVAMGAAALLCFAAQVMILKRTPLIGLVLGGFLLILYYGWRNWLTFGTLGLIGLLAAFTLSASLREKFEQVLSIQAAFTQNTQVNQFEGTAKWHYALPAAGFLMWRESPILGKGAGAYGGLAETYINRLNFFKFHVKTDRYRQPHNFVIKVLAEAGLVGMLLFGWFLASVAWTCFKASRRSGPGGEHLVRGLMAAVAVVFLVAAAQNPQQWSVFWLIPALANRAATLQLQGRLGPLPSRAPAPTATGATPPFARVPERPRARSQPAWSATPPSPNRWR